MKILQKDPVEERHVDLHTHTTASDGLLKPEELVQFASIKGLAAIAITDHDTTDGIEEGIKAGKKYHVDVLPGIELNTQIEDQEIHILGYYIHYKETWLQNILNKIRKARDIRGQKMIERLNSLYGFDLDYNEVKRIAGDAAVGRLHIGRVMLEKGIVKNLAEAFENYLGTNSPAYVERYKLSPREGIQMIKKAGGVAVLAHPGLIDNQRLVQKIIDEGIQGIEAFHTKHNDEQASYYCELAKRNHLIVTGGSDCHGELINGMPIVGDIRVGYEVIDAIKELANLHKV